MVFFFVSRGVGGEARLRQTCANPLGQRLFDLSPFFTALWSSCRRTENMRSYAASREYRGSIHRSPARFLKKRVKKSAADLSQFIQKIRNIFLLPYV